MADNHRFPFGASLECRRLSHIGGPAPARGHRARQRNALALLAVGALASLGAAGCARHVRLMSPGTDQGARYVCTAKGGCQPAETDVPADDNPSNTASITLPEQCAGKFHQILIVDAGSSEPTVRVTCAPAEEPIETMAAPEASNAAGGH